MKKLNALQIQMLELGQIQGFSIPFSRILLEKLKKLKKENRIFCDQEKRKDRKKTFKTTPITCTVLFFLNQQIPTGLLYRVDFASTLEIEGVILATKEFLETFDIKTKKGGCVGGDS